MNKSESIASLAKALAKAQSEVENANKGSVNPHFKSKYADLAEVINTVRPVFSANGLSFVQMPSFDAGVVNVETVLMHESGEWVSEIASAPVTKQDAQGVGSAITYLRRYSMAAFAGIAQEDDDANASIGKKKDSAVDRPKEGSMDNEYLILCERFHEQIAAIKIGIHKKDYSSAVDAWNSISDEDKTVLWRATTKGGCFTTEERAIMKTTEFREAANKAK
jgi:hypothetical protein